MDDILYPQFYNVNPTEIFYVIGEVDENYEIEDQTPFPELGPKEEN